MTSKVVLKGSIAFIELGELLQQLGTSGSTGIVKLMCEPVEEPGYIYIKEGNPINAECGDRKGIEALNDFFGWTNAEFEFIQEEVTCDPVIKKSRMEIILDGLRMFDDGLIPEIGAPSHAEEGGQQKGKTENDLPLIKGPVIDYVYVVDEEEFPDGTDVVAQDKFGNWFWVILAGKMEVIRILPEGGAPIVRLADGAYIGSIVSFLREGNVRSATVKAIGNVQLGVLDSELISREYSAMTDDLQSILISIDKRLRQVTDVCAMAVLQQNVMTDRHKKMKLLMSSNKNENKCLRITAGEVYVIRSSPAGDIHLCTLSQGDFVGAIPFLNTSHEPYSANVYASRDFNAEAFDLGKVRREYDRLSQTFKNMIDYLSTSISVTTGRVLDLTRTKSANAPES
ncbi:MAG: cyclic nucleotide-binding domain-containing protein [Thermodesulfobacteriota bacterium]